MGHLVSLRPDPGVAHVDALAAARVAENVAVFGQLEALAGMYLEWLPDPVERREDRRLRRKHTSAESLHEAAVVSEAAATLEMTEGAAARRVDAALALLVTGRLPRTAHLARRGRLDWRRVDTIVTRTRHLEPQDAQAVEAQVLVPAVMKLTIGRFEDAVDRAVLAVDPAAAERRRLEVNRGRRVSFFKHRNGADGSDGGGTLWVSGPSDGLAGAMAVLDATARWYQGQGDTRTLDQLRHDLLVTACTTGRVDAPQTLTSAALAAALTAPDGTLPDAAAVALAPRPEVPVHVNVTVSLQTLLGLNDEPGVLAGFGPIPAQMVRDMATHAIWRCVAVDDRHGTVLGVGRKTYSHGYAPGTNLKEFLKVASPTCEIPWCDTKAEHCDLDHRTPHAAGGATCACNVGPTCRRHHREKSAGILTVRPSPDPAHPLGTNIWTTPGGQEFTVYPYIPLPPEAYRTPRPQPSPAPPVEAKPVRIDVCMPPPF